MFTVLYPAHEVVRVSDVCAYGDTIAAVGEDLMNSGLGDSYSSVISAPQEPGFRWGWLLC